MPENVKRIDIAEFRERGYLQEANRLFFHPLGLALEVIVDEDAGTTKLGGIWDSREDPEGFVFADFDPVKAAKVMGERVAKIPARVALGCCAPNGEQIKESPA